MKTTRLPRSRKAGPANTRSTKMAGDGTLRQRIQLIPIRLKYDLEKKRQLSEQRLTGAQVGPGPITVSRDPAKFRVVGSQRCGEPRQ